MKQTDRLIRIRKAFGYALLFVALTFLALNVVDIYARFGKGVGEGFYDATHKQND